jgi:asparagine synthase (glutamine-hydrolysing)
MAHSLEVRAPLLDHRILEFAARLPAKMKMNMRRGKLPLRALAARRLPANIKSMPKRGFSIPAAQWLREELRPMAEDVVFERNGIVADTLDTKVLRDMWKQHQNKSRDHSVFLWGLMMLGLWEKTGNRTSLP